MATNHKIDETKICMFIECISVFFAFLYSNSLSPFFPVLLSYIAIDGFEISSCNYTVEGVFVYVCMFVDFRNVNKSPLNGKYQI